MVPSVVGKGILLMLVLADEEALDVKLGMGLE